MHLILRSNGTRDLSALRNSPGGEQVAGENKERKKTNGNGNSKQCHVTTVVYSFDFLLS